MHSRLAVIPSKLYLASSPRLLAGEALPLRMYVLLVFVSSFRSFQVLLTCLHVSLLMTICDVLSADGPAMSHKDPELLSSSALVIDLSLPSGHSAPPEGFSSSSTVSSVRVLTIFTVSIFVRLYLSAVLLLDFDRIRSAFDIPSQFLPTIIPGRIHTYTNFSRVNPNRPIPVYPP